MFCFAKKRSKVLEFLFGQGSVEEGGLCVKSKPLATYCGSRVSRGATLPLIIGLATLSGIMVVFRFDFNFFNLIVVPMIAGIGIDDGVHLTNTFRQRHPADIPD